MEYVIIGGTHYVPQKDGPVLVYREGDIIDCNPATAAGLLKGKVKPKSVVDAEKAAQEAADKATNDAAEEMARASRPPKTTNDEETGEQERSGRRRSGG